MVKFHTPFNRPFIAGKELYHIAQAVTFGNLGGDGPFSQKCCHLLEERFAISTVLLTPSCTSALELSAMLCLQQPGDEVILPSFTFVSTANAVVRAGGVPVFAEIRPDTLNIDESQIEGLVGPRTRAIIPVHYAGVGCEMDDILAIARKHDLAVIEDAAQAVDAFFKDRALGSMGHLGSFSFHETKNLICGEGGALCINDERYLDRAHVLRDKGTNRQQLLRGEVQKYQWMEIGSSSVPSELVAAFLFGQLEEMDLISDRRRQAYAFYEAQLAECEEEGLLRLPVVPQHCVSNHHLFYILVPTNDVRDSLEEHLARCGIQAISHFEPLHSSPMGRRFASANQDLSVTDAAANRILRLPLFFEITESQQERVVLEIRSHLEKQSRRFI